MPDVFLVLHRAEVNRGRKIRVYDEKIDRHSHRIRPIILQWSQCHIKANMLEQRENTETCKTVKSLTRWGKIRLRYFNSVYRNHTKYFKLADIIGMNEAKMSFYLDNWLRVQRQQVNIVNSFGEIVRLNSRKHTRYITPSDDQENSSDIIRWQWRHSLLLFVVSVADAIL